MMDKELETMLETLIHKIDVQNTILCHIYKKKLPKWLIRRAIPHYLYYVTEDKDEDV